MSTLIGGIEGMLIMAAIWVASGFNVGTRGIAIFLLIVAAAGVNNYWVITIARSKT